MPNARDDLSIRQDRDKLSRRVEVDEFYLGAIKSGKRGRGAEGKTIVAIAAERSNVERRMGRIRLHIALDSSAYSLETSILENIEPGSTVATDSLRCYNFLDNGPYVHEKTNQTNTNDYKNLYGVHLVTSLIKRLIRGTYQGRFEPKYLQNYLDEYVFRFNRRKSKSIGNKFMRIIQQ